MERILKRRTRKQDNKKERKMKSLDEKWKPRGKRKTHTETDPARERDSESGRDKAKERERAREADRQTVRYTHRERRRKKEREWKRDTKTEWKLLKSARVHTRAQITIIILHWHLHTDSVQYWKYQTRAVLSDRRMFVAFWQIWPVIGQFTRSGESQSSDDKTWCSINQGLQLDEAGWSNKKFVICFLILDKLWKIGWCAQFSARITADYNLRLSEPPIYYDLIEHLVMLCFAPLFLRSK